MTYLPMYQNDVVFERSKTTPDYRIVRYILLTCVHTPRKDSQKTRFNRCSFRALFLLVEQNRVQFFLRQHKIQYQKTISIVPWNIPHSIETCST